MSKKELNYASIAAAFAAIGDQIMVLEGAFRVAASGGESAGGDDEAGEPVPAKRTRTAKPAAAKPAAAKPSKGGAAETPEVTEDSLRESLKELSAAKGKAMVTKALAVVGAGRLPDVDEDDYAALDTAIKGFMEADDEEEDAPAKPAKGKAAPAKGKAKPAPVPDLDELTESFKSLIDVNKVAAKQILKDAGLAKLTEIDTDDDDAMRDMAAAITAALAEEEDGDMV